MNYILNDKKNGAAGDSQTRFLKQEFYGKTKYAFKLIYMYVDVYHQCTNNVYDRCSSVDTPSLLEAWNRSELSCC